MKSPSSHEGFVQILPLDFDGLDDAEALYAAQAQAGHVFDATLEMARPAYAPTQWWAKPTEI